MIEIWETDDPDDARFARGATGLLAEFNRAGVLTAADVHVATRAGELVGEGDDEVRLALALAVRAARHGSVCVDLAELVESASDGPPELPWPAADGWLEKVSASPLLERSVVRVGSGLLYLDRYWREEGQVRDDLLARLAGGTAPVDDAVLQASADRLFPGEGYAEQRAAATAAARQTTTVLTGGPGTGKTTTVAGLLALLTEQAALHTPTPLRIALTAPTGKAAARLQEAVADAQQAGRFTDHDRARLSGLTASTLHRLLGWRPGSSTRFKHHRRNRLPHDVIVVDETSMVSLTMMARLLEAVRPDTRLVLVGDPDQLASVEAGAVLSDLVQGLQVRAPAAVAQLRTTHRYGAGIGDLAEALRAGDGQAALAVLDAGDDVELVDPDDEEAMAAVRAELVDGAVALRRAALAGDRSAATAALDSHRLLCAHREGPFGVEHWNRQVERWVSEATGSPLGSAWGHEWYPGRPVLVTANDYGLGLFNGDTGVTLAVGEDLRVAIGGRAETLTPSRLGDVETLHAMTVHKSQGSQADVVTVLLPPDDSPLLTRELFYTAVTRAQSRVRVIGSRAAVTAAVERRALRASGLRSRLAGPPRVDLPPA